MDVLLKPIEVVASFSRDGTLRPIRFRVITDDTGYETILVSTISRRRREQIGKASLDIYTCLGSVMGRETPFELKYENTTGEWTLYRI